MSAAAAMRVRVFTGVLRCAGVGVGDGRAALAVRVGREIPGPFPVAWQPMRLQALASMPICWLSEAVQSVSCEAVAKKPSWALVWARQRERRHLVTKKPP